ncbi:nucleoside triphosphate pyrophosphatase [Blastomonas sp.]|uniref:Maf family protein n=1 Tax=Blastomonas sp. TaxID=1909299 RepID=UPI003593F771
MLILASQSTARRAMLDAADVPFTVVAAHIDESAIRGSLHAEGTTARDIADALAEAKAMRVGARRPESMVLGSDQILETAEGDMLSKPQTPDDAIRQLEALSGKPHRLWSAAVIVEGGRPIWRHVEKAVMHVRPLGSAFVRDYVDKHWETIGYTVGCYEIEGPGAQLFSQIEGSYFAVLGMPLLPLLGFLRERELMPT